jgi:hypothetical protein
VLQNRELRSEFFFISNNQLISNQARISSYQQSVTDFLKLLFALFHFTAGAPARGTEWAILLHSNSFQSQRNLFLDPKEGLFLIKLRYSKTFSTTGLEREAIRYIPSSVSYLVLIYLSVILPFIQFLNLSTTGQESKANELLFYSVKGLKATDLSQQLRNLGK